MIRWLFYIITSDKNLKHQQNLSNRQPAIIQLPTNQVPMIIDLTPKVKQILASIRPGEFVEIPPTDT